MTRRPYVTIGSVLATAPLDHARIARTYAAGFTLAELAKSEGVSSSTIHRSLVASGVPRRPPGGERGKGHRGVRRVPTTDELVDSLVADYRRLGVSIFELAIRSGISRRRISRILRSNGVKPLRGGRPHKQGALLARIKDGRTE